MPIASIKNDSEHPVADQRRGQPNHASKIQGNCESQRNGGADQKQCLPVLGFSVGGKRFSAGGARSICPEEARMREAAQAHYGPTVRAFRLGEQHPKTGITVDAVAR